MKNEAKAIILKVFGSSKVGFKYTKYNCHEIVSCYSKDGHLYNFKPRSNQAVRRMDEIASGYAKIKEDFLDKEGRVCLRCGTEESVTVDHIIPYSKAPELLCEESNLQPLCTGCNLKKGLKQTNYRKDNL